MESSYDPSCDLSLDNEKPPCTTIILEAFEDKPLQQGTKVYLGATDRIICPIKAVLYCIWQRGAVSLGPSLSPRRVKGGHQPCLVQSSSFIWQNSRWKSNAAIPTVSAKEQQHLYHSQTYQILTYSCLVIGEALHSNDTF